MDENENETYHYSTSCEEYGHDYYTVGNTRECADCGDSYEVEDDDNDDVGFQFEHDSSMTSVGWGTDEDYGYYGGDEYE